MVLSALRDRRERVAAARRALQRHLSVVDIVGDAPADLSDAAPFTNVELARRRFNEVVAAASTEYLAMNPEASFSRASAATAIPVSRSALRNGARTLSLGVPTADDDQSESYASELYAYGMEYRELPRQPVKLAIVDRRTAFFPIDPSQNFYGGLWELTDPLVVGELASFFMRHWEVAVAPSHGWRPPSDLTDRERAVLAALAAGDTDEMAGKRLRLSSRTIRYVVSDLMERYQVKTRFQLGLVIGRHNEGEQS
jgi:DNA-binding CsgD family transcriptional regulator